MPHDSGRRRVDPRTLVARLNADAASLRGREIVAPLVPNGRIRTRLDGLVHTFRVREPFVGWGRFRPRDAAEAEVLGEALPWQRGAYLELFPMLRAVLLWPDETATASGLWWALPFNPSDAAQRFGLPAGEPVPVGLADPFGGADRFERVLCRVDGDTLWFDGPDPLADPAHAEWLRDAADRPEGVDRFLPGLAASERTALLYHEIRLADQGRPLPPHQMSSLPRDEPAQRAWLRRAQSERRTETRLRHALARAGATLLSFAETVRADGSPGEIVVEWADGAGTRRYRSAIAPNLTVTSSGICLSGRDRDFDLTSLVSVMRASPW